MRERILGVVVGVATLAGMPGWAQMHQVAAPQQVVRAVGVYEWTGDLAKPKASRLIPVSLFINGQFQDAGVYMAQPVPFALDTGNVYELRVAGIDKGTLDLEYSRHLQATDQSGDQAYDDGWFGYGSFKTVTPEMPRVAKRLPRARTAGIVSSVDDDSDRPTLVRRHGSDSSAGSGPSTTASAGNTTASGSAPADDPNRPTLTRRASGSGSGSDAGSSGSSASADAGAPADDPDRPTLTRPAPSSSGESAGTDSGAPADDPDRPTLKRRSPEEAKKTIEEASVSGTGLDAALNDDPNRPRLHYGKPAGAIGDGGPARLVGMPVDLHQMIAVSDAVNRDPHNFARNWADAAERAAVLEKMQAMARAQLAAYDAPAVAAPAKKRGGTNKLRRMRAPVAPPPVALMDEVLKGYTLSYGGDPTYVYTAHTAGTGAALRYVTVVAQRDEMGELQPAIQSVTDAAHLDRTAQMKFVDVVDADASNRASLLFELRWQSSRQFALYRVIAGQSQQVFVSGSTQ